MIKKYSQKVRTNFNLYFKIDMPKVKKREKDEDYTPGKSRAAGYYNPRLDDRNVHKQLMKIKCK